MPTQPNSRLDVLTREIDLEAAILADTRKKAMFDQESQAAAKRIRFAKAALNALRSSMGIAPSTNGANGVNGAAAGPESPKPARKRQRTRKIGQRKIDFVMDAISSITAPEFTADDILEAVRRLHPEADITRGGLSSLMWKLSKMPEGQRLCKQIVAWSGGANPARYVKNEEDRDTLFGPSRTVRPPAVPENLAGKNGK